MKVAFLVNDLQLSGGIGVVVAHALQLARHHGFEVALVLVREQDDPHWDYEPLRELEILSFPQACEAHFDIAVATWWETTYSLFERPGRALRVLRPVARGPLLRVRRRRAPRRRG